MHREFIVSKTMESLCPRPCDPMVSKPFMKHRNRYPERTWTGCYLTNLMRILILSLASQPALSSTHWSFHSSSHYNQLIDYHFLPYQANPTHVVLAPKYIRQGQPYRLLVTLYQVVKPVTITASIQRDGVEISKHEREIAQDNVPELITLELPTSLPAGTYRLFLEGSLNDFNGGIAFSNDTSLTLLQRSLTIIVQTDRPVYKQGQNVKFRVVPVTGDFDSYQDAVDVYMLNPNGMIMKRWLSRRTLPGGWVNLEYQLSDTPQKGRWSIKVKANGYSHEEHFFVKEYYTPPFEVRLHSPSFIVSSSQFLRGTVYANYTSGAPVVGNISVVALLEALRDEDTKESRGYEMSLDAFTGVWDFEFPIGDLLRSTKNLEHHKLLIKAKVTDSYTSLVRKGFSETLIFKKSYTIRFLGPSKQVFKPGLPFRAYIQLRYQDGTPLEEEWFRGRPPSQFLRGSIFVPGLAAQPKLPHPHIISTNRHDSTWEVLIDATPNWSNSTRPIFLEAHFFDEYFGVERTKLVLLPEFSENSHHLMISTSTRNARIGEYIIFHARANYYVESFHYIIMSKGVIVKAGYETMTSSIRTFAVSLTKEMAPKSLIIIYDLTSDDKMLSDSLEFVVDAISMNKMSIKYDYKDHSGANVELAIQADMGSHIGISSQPIDVLTSYIHHPISRTKMDSLLEYKDCPVPPASQVDTYTTLQSSGLMVFTDAYVGRRAQVCNVTSGYASCFDGSCYRVSKMCNGEIDCADGADEYSCHHRHQIDWEEFRRTRRNFVSSDFETTWLWKDISISTSGKTSLSIASPSTPSSWALSALAISPFRGVYTLPNPEMVSPSRSFYIDVESPSFARLGEHFSVRVSLFNYGQTKLEVLVTLANCLDYKFVYVNNALDEKPLHPITMFGEHQHLVFLWPHRPVVLHFPIIGIRAGTTNITVAAKTQTAKATISKSIDLLPLGSHEPLHASMMIDIAQGAYVIKQLDTGITSAGVQDHHNAKKTAHSLGDFNTAVITITGSAFGPAFPVFPITSESLFGLPSESGEANMFGFAANLLNLFLIKNNKALVRSHRNIFNHLVVAYQKQLSYQREDSGGFVMFKYPDVQPSVWLTAFTARYFHKANTLFEWRNFVHIDQRVLEKAIQFLLSMQTKNGAFQDSDGYFTYDRKMSLRICADDTQKVANVSLTAYVVIALYELRTIEGPLRPRIDEAIRSSQVYLQWSLTFIAKEEDPFQLAIVAYALKLISSTDADYAFTLLDRKYIADGEMRYWSKRSQGSFSDYPMFPSLHTSSTPPRVEPVRRSVLHGLDVETTSYALLAYLHGKAVMVKPIVEWLNSQRKTSGGWSSTQDTIVALEALLEYEKRTFGSDAAERELSMTITLEAACLPGISKQFHVGIMNRHNIQKFRIPNAWGSITVRARGVGVALLQMHLERPTPPERPRQPVASSYSLNVKVFTSGRNHSRLHFRSCQSWLATDENQISGLSILEADLPTGYMLDRDTLVHYVTMGTSRNLRHAHSSEGKAVFYFDYLDISPICINFTAIRILPAANISKHLLVKVYEYHEPERFNQSVVDVSMLHRLRLCDVCGSYQCQECPSYNSAFIPPCPTLSILVLIIVCLRSIVCQNV